MSYADAFAAASAARHGAPLLTGDPGLLVTPDLAPDLPTWNCIDLR